MSKMLLKSEVQVPSVRFDETVRFCFE